MRQLDNSRLGGSAAASIELGEFLQEATELRSLVGTEGGKQITLRFALNADALVVRAPAGVGDARKARAAIARIGRAQHEAVRFEAFDELRDVGFDAGEPLGQLPQRERLVGR